MKRVNKLRFTNKKGVENIFNTLLFVKNYRSKY